MPFKNISYLEPFNLSEQNLLCNFGRGHYQEQFCEIILNLGQWLRRCCLKDFLSGALTASCSVEKNHLCNFGIRHHEEHSYFKFRPVVQEEMLFKEKV